MQFVNNWSDYVVTRTPSGSGVALKTAPTDYAIVLQNRMEFADVWVAVDIDGIPGQVYRLYRAALRRAPDLSGLGYHIGSVECKGLAMTDLANNFMASPEFSALYGSLTNEQFVRQLYLNVLNREPDTGGLSFHVGNLARGVYSRAQVLNQFSESPENKANTAAAVDNGIGYLPWPAPMSSPFVR